ncbi:hypothetical protein F5B19DRAFT_468782 [Rostrohypoxylon terebratum]|nr:hypothetical protein F5B19DRAFT_468782 [Rostrohypoxylon terebratum]
MAYSTHLRLVSNRPGLIALASFFCVITITAVTSRFHARWITRAGFATDDWLTLVALGFVLALNGIFIAGTVQGAITGHSPIENDWPVTTELEHLAQKYKYAFQTTEKVTFGLIKLAILFLWKRIFGPAGWFVRLCWCMIVIICAWSISFFFATLFQCGTEWTWNWAPIGIFLTQCTNTLNMLTVFTATDLLTDFIIMFMPVPLIWKLHMPTRRKIGVTCIFMLGLFTIGAGIARMYIYLVTSYDKEDNPDFIADFTLFILWSEIEVNVAMVVCCLPTLAPIIGKFNEGLITLLGPSHPSHWTLLSSGRAASKISDIGVELPVASKTRTFSPAGLTINETVPWEGDPRMVTEAGYNKNTNERFQQRRGIIARTDIYRSFEAIP